MVTEEANCWDSVILKQNRHALLIYLRVATGNVSAAEDILQDVFKVAYEKRDTFTPGTNF